MVKYLSARKHGYEREVVPANINTVGYTRGQIREAFKIYLCKTAPSSKPSSPPPKPKATRQRSEPHEARPRPIGAARHHRTSPSPPKAKVSDSSSFKNRNAASSPNTGSSTATH